jgi:hypothetical protein
MREWISGSLVVTARKQGSGIRPFRYLSRSIGGKNRITYVSEKHMGVFEEQLKNGKRAEWLFREISELTAKIVKSAHGNSEGGK